MKNQSYVGKMTRKVNEHTYWSIKPILIDGLQQPEERLVGCPPVRLVEVVTRAIQSAVLAVEACVGTVNVLVLIPAPGHVGNQREVTRGHQLTVILLCKYKETYHIMTNSFPLI